MQTISSVFKQYHYTLDPHGAVAYKALNDYLGSHPGHAGILLETAHPVKFPETVEKATGEKIAMPQSASDLFNREKQSIQMDASFQALKAFLLSR